MNINCFEIAKRIAAWLTGTATEKERQELEDWGKKNSRNAALLDKLSQEEDFEENRKQLETFPADEAWENIQGRLGEAKTRTLRWTVLWKYAAILLILVGTGILYRVLTSPVQVEKTIVAEVIPFGKQGARLTLGNGKVMEVTPDNRFTLSEADGTLIRKDSVGIDYRQQDVVTDSVVYNQMETLTGMEYTLTLADGTKVYLNAESRLRFPVAFREDRREVELSGEAYFKVTKDLAHPFVVKMNGLELKVLGTSFNVRAYADEEQVLTTLVEGQVEVNGQKMKPGEQAVYSRETGKLDIQTVDVDQFVAWQSGRFVFRNERLEDILKTLARWYEVDYHFVDEEVKDIRIGARFGRYEDMKPIVDMLQKTDLVNVVQTNRSLYFSVKK